jgi:hypothetical protein
MLSLPRHLYLTSLALGAPVVRHHETHHGLDRNCNTAPENTHLPDERKCCLLLGLVTFYWDDRPELFA